MTAINQTPLRPLSAKPLAVMQHVGTGALLDCLPVPFFAVAADGSILLSNQTWELEPDCNGGNRAVPTTLLDWVASGDHTQVETLLHQIFHRGDANCDAHLIFQGGAPVPHFLVGHTAQHEGVSCAMIICVDITTRIQAESRNRYLATHDALTGLSNRAMLHDSLARASCLAKRQERPIAVLFLDLDDFKPINDRAGHAVGDVVLCAVARRLEQAVRDSDSVFRYGGDEFVIVLRTVSNEQGAETVAQKIAAAITRPISHEGVEYQVGVSIGIAMYPAAAISVKQLIAIADAAMYKAKRAGKGRVEFGGHRPCTQPILLLDAHATHPQHMPA